MEQKPDYQKPIFIALLILTVIAVAAVLKMTASVVLPLTIAILISLVFEPVLVKLHRTVHMPWAVGIVIILVIVAAVLYVVGQLIATSVTSIVNTMPKYEERFVIIYQTIANALNLPFDPDDTLFNNLWNQMGVRSAVQNFLISLSTGTISFVKSFVMVLLCAIFFLAEMRYLRMKLQAACISPEEENDRQMESQQRVTLMITGIIDQVTRYISTKFFISLLTGILVFVGLKVIGLDFAVIWAFFAFVLNFVPSFGSIISVLGTTLFALLQFWPRIGPVFWVFLFMFLVNFTLGNIIEPRVQGKNLGLSPFVIIASLSLWGWIWGFTGLILGVPMMVIVKIVCENFPFLHPVAVILGSYTPPEDKPLEQKPSA